MREPATKERRPGAARRPEAGAELLAAAQRFQEAEKAVEAAMAELEEARAEVVAVFQAAGPPYLPLRPLGLVPGSRLLEVEAKRK